MYGLKSCSMFFQVSKFGPIFFPCYIMYNAIRKIFEGLANMFSFMLLNKQNSKSMYIIKILFLASMSTQIGILICTWIPKVPMLGGIVYVDLILGPSFFILFDPIHLSLQRSLAFALAAITVPQIVESSIEAFLYGCLWNVKLTSNWPTWLAALISNIVSIMISISIIRGKVQLFKSEN